MTSLHGVNACALLFLPCKWYNVCGAYSSECAVDVNEISPARKIRKYYIFYKHVCSTDYTFLISLRHKSKYISMMIWRKCRLTIV